jgi:hypothetical protein
MGDDTCRHDTGWTVKPHHSGRFPAGRIGYTAPRDESETGATAQCNSAPALESSRDATFADDSRSTGFDDRPGDVETVHVAPHPGSDSSRPALSRCAHAAVAHSVPLNPIASGCTSNLDHPSARGRSGGGSSRCLLDRQTGRHVKHAKLALVDFE